MKKVLPILGISLLAIPTIAVAADTERQVQQYFDYKVGTTASTTEQYAQITTTESEGLKYQYSYVNVTDFLADSGGDGSYCSWCQLTVSAKKKGTFGIYSKIKGGKTITTTTTGSYNGGSYGEVGYGTFRHYIKNTNHYSSSGTYQINTQNYKQ